MKYNIMYNNKINEELDIEVVKRPVIPIAIRRFKTIEIEGHDGNYYIDEETYEDIVISIDFNFVENDLDNIRQRVRNIKKWIEDMQDNKLILSDDQSVFYKVCKAELSEVTYADLYEIQSFSINFTCKAHIYTMQGQKELKINGVLFNYWDKCKPIYRITGTGNCVLNVNGNIVNCDVTNQLTINSEYDKILNSSNTIAIGSTDIKIMQDLYLIEGKNTITITSGFDLYVKPNFRSI